MCNVRQERKVRGRIRGSFWGCSAGSTILTGSCSARPEPAAPAGETASTVAEAAARKTPPAAPTSGRPGTVAGMAPAAVDDMPSVILLQSKTALVTSPGRADGEIDVREGERLTLTFKT
jgi:hypothetical protein